MPIQFAGAAFIFEDDQIEKLLKELETVKSYVMCDIQSEERYKEYFPILTNIKLQLEDAQNNINQIKNKS